MALRCGKCDASAWTHCIDKDCPMLFKGKKRMGFAAMSPEKQKEIARKGGKAAHAKGVAHEYSVEEAREAGRKGAAAVLKKYGRKHYQDIGRKGGSAGSKD